MVAKEKDLLVIDVQQLISTKLLVFIIRFEVEKRKLWETSKIYIYLISSITNTGTGLVHSSACTCPLISPENKCVLNLCGFEGLFIETIQLSTLNEYGVFLQLYYIKGKRIKMIRSVAVRLMDLQSNSELQQLSKHDFLFAIIFHQNNF